MSFVPLLRELSVISDMDHLFEDSFGLGIHPLDISRPRHSSLAMQPCRRYCPYGLVKYGRPRYRDFPAEKSEVIPAVGKDGFQVCMDVSQFTPKELTVKTVDRTVVVEGKHEEREDEHGFIQRHFIRKYTLPKGYDPKSVVSTLSSDGVLTVKAPPPPSATKGSTERVVQIQQTGPAHLSIKQPEQTEKPNKEMETK